MVVHDLTYGLCGSTTASHDDSYLWRVLVYFVQRVERIAPKCRTHRLKHQKEQSFHMLDWIHSYIGGGLATVVLAVVRIHVRISLVLGLP